MEYKTVSIVIPVFNEANTIQTVIDGVKKAETSGLEKEIVLVDDFSTDGTRGLLQKMNDPSLRIIYHEKNKGKGAALHTGFAAATGDIAVVQDADLEYDPQEIRNLVQPFLERGAQVVYGSRYLNPSVGLGFWHSLFNKLFTKISNLLTRQEITDIMTCYKAFDLLATRGVLEKLESKRFGFEPEITAKISKAGFRIIEVPVTYKPRSRNQGKHMNFMGQMESLWALIKYSLLKK